MLFPGDLWDDPRIPEPRQQTLLYCNRNPEGDPCPICKPDIGRVFITGTQPRVPRHAHCYCYYTSTKRRASSSRTRR